MPLPPQHGLSSPRPLRPPFGASEHWHRSWQTLRSRLVAWDGPSRVPCSRDRLPSRCSPSALLSLFSTFPFICTTRRLHPTPDTLTKHPAAGRHRRCLATPPRDCCCAALMSYYRPATAARQAALVPASSALLFIDVQRYNCSQEGAIYQALSQEQRQARAVCCGGVGMLAAATAAPPPGTLRKAGRMLPHCTANARPATQHCCLPLSPDPACAERWHPPLFRPSGGLRAAVGCAAGGLQVGWAGVSLKSLCWPAVGCWCVPAHQQAGRRGRGCGHHPAGLRAWRSSIP